jgi:hypothetical protein
MTEDAIETMRKQLEWDCNETNNHHCRIVTKMHDDPRRLIVMPETDNKGSYIKTSGWSNVVRDIVRAEERHEGLLMSAEPGKLVLVVTDY